jgi:transposase
MKGSVHKVYVGIDVHRKTHKVAVLPVTILQYSESNWKTARMLDIKNNYDDFQSLDTAIREHISYPEEAIIAIDHTGGHYSEPITYFLQQKGYHICYLEPKGVALIRDRLLDEESKSDTTDAASMANLLYLRDMCGLSFRISVVTPQLGSIAMILRQLIIQRQQYTKIITQITNRLHSILLATFPEGEAKCFPSLMRIVPYHPTPTDIVESQELKSIGRVGASTKEAITVLAASTVGVPSEIYRELILNLSQQRLDAIARRDDVSRSIGEKVATHPYGRILLSFPNFGPIAAATIISVIRDINWWPNKKKLRKALGVYSTLRQSGDSAGRGKMGREGNRHARRALFQVIFRSIQENKPDNDFKDYYRRQIGRGKPKLKAIVATMGKLAEVIFHCLQTGELYSYQGKYRNRSYISAGDNESNKEATPKMQTDESESISFSE